LYFYIVFSYSAFQPQVCVKNSVSVCQCVSRLYAHY